MSNNTQAERAELILPPILDLTTAADLKRDLVQAIAEGRGVTIDAGNVQRVSSLCFQLLVAAAREPGVCFSKTSDGFRNAASTLALSEALGISDGDNV